jgi:serine/threonine-protein kinase RsbW
MPAQMSLLYLGPDHEAVGRACEGSAFDPLIPVETTEAAVTLLRSEAHSLTAALLDASVDSDELEEMVAYVNRSFPEVVIALAGEASEEESKRLRLLGISLETDATPTSDQLAALGALASRSASRKPGKTDWSFKVERGNWVEISVPSKETYVQRVQELVDMLEKTNLDQDVRDELMLALDELVRNAMEWGNQFEEDRRVTVSYYCSSDRIVIRVEDEGEGFDHSDVTDPTQDLKGHTESREAAGKRAGGFGIHLIRNMMDDVLYSEKGNVVMLTKYLDQDVE